MALVPRLKIIWMLLCGLTITLICLCEKEPLPTRRREGHREIDSHLYKDYTRSAVNPPEQELPCPGREETNSEWSPGAFKLGRWLAQTRGHFYLRPDSHVSFSSSLMMRERGKINQKSCWHLQRTESQFVVFHPHWKRNGPRFFTKLCSVGLLDPKHSHLLSFLENCLETSSVLGHWADIFRVLQLL